MATPFSLHFSAPPALAPSYLKILLSRKPSLVNRAVPRIGAVLERFTVDTQHLHRYRRICGIPDSDSLPIAYPHVLAAPLHLAMFSSERFPVNLLGVVHIRNRIEQQRPVRCDEAGEVRTWLEGHRETARGQEFDLHTQLLVGSATVWSETATFLARRPDRNRARGADGSPLRRDPPLPRLEIPSRTEVRRHPFTVGSEIGRKYARVSGDFNPIHIADAAARLFGFKRAVAHGMWSLARCTAELGAQCFERPCALDVEFKRPVLFRVRAVLESWIAAERLGFALLDEQQRTHLHGTVTMS